jgi:hypothetical protein
MCRSEHEETFDDVYERDLQWIEERANRRRRPPAPLYLPSYRVKIGCLREEPRPNGKVSVPGLLFLLGFIGTGFLIVTLYPYRVLILHLAVGLLILLMLVLWSILALKIRRRIRLQRSLEEEERPPYVPRVHDAPPSEYRPLRQYSDPPPAPALSDFQHIYDDRINKRLPEQLDPDQRRRF